MGSTKGQIHENYWHICNIKIHKKELMYYSIIEDVGLNYNLMFKERSQL